MVHTWLQSTIKMTRDGLIYSHPADLKTFCLFSLDICIINGTDRNFSELSTDVNEQMTKLTLMPVGRRD